MKNGKLAFFNLFSFASVSALNSQLIPFITVNGYSPAEKTFILGMSALIAFLASLAVGAICDATARFKPAVFASLGLYSLFTLIALMIESSGFQILALAFAFGIVKQVMSLNETWTFLSEPQKFGLYHCMAALGLVFGSLICGVLAKSQMLYVGLFCLFAALMAVFFAWQLPEVERKAQKISKQAFMELCNNRSYMVLLWVLFLLMAVGFADQFVVLDKLMSLSENKMLVTYKFAIQSFAEIPFYVVLVYLLKKVSPMQLLLFASLMSGVKFALYGFAVQPYQILLVATLQTVTHPVIVVASKQLIQKVTPASLSATTQVVGYAVYFGLSGFMTPLLALWLIPLIGINALLLVFAFLAAFAFVIGLGMKKSGKYDTLEKEVRKQDENIFD